MGSDDLHKKRKVERLERESKRRLEKPRILILTEGESEKIYLEGLKLVQIIKSETVEIKKSKYTDPPSILKEAGDLSKKATRDGNKFNYIFCVFDLDNKTQSIKGLMQNRSNKSKPKIIPICHYPCIEVWFLLHLGQLTTSPFNATGTLSVGDVAKRELRKHWTEYTETNPSIFKYLHEKQPDFNAVIEGAKSLVASQKAHNSYNPISNMHQLIEFLINVSNEQYDTNMFDGCVEQLFLGGQH